MRSSGQVSLRFIAFIRGFGSFGFNFQLNSFRLQLDLAALTRYGAFRHGLCSRGVPWYCVPSKMRYMYLSERGVPAPSPVISNSLDFKPFRKFQWQYCLGTCFPPWRTFESTHESTLYQHTNNYHNKLLFLVCGYGVICCARWPILCGLRYPWAALGTINPNKYRVLDLVLKYIQWGIGFSRNAVHVPRTGIPLPVLQSPVQTPQHRYSTSVP